MSIRVNIYPNTGKHPTIEFSDKDRPNTGICFSGGGSRAMTCAWGQLTGLKGLGITDRARYISSVSGGTWASAVFSYLPGHITDGDLLGDYVPPEHLSLQGGKGKLDVNTLSEHSMGKAPAGMSVADLVEESVLFLLFHPKSDHKWLWAYLVAEHILEPYGLRAEGKEPWSSSRYFSLSRGYAGDCFPKGAPSLTDFFFTRSGRPFVIMNNNLMEEAGTSDDKGRNIVQLPGQVTPVSGGVPGKTPDGGITGGGTVESYGYCSQLDQSSGIPSPAKADISQPYSLIDIVSTSSAFFAETIARYIRDETRDKDKKKALVGNIEKRLGTSHRNRLLDKAEKDLPHLKGIEEIIEHELENMVLDSLSFLRDIVPSYNYWSVTDPSTNREIEYTDGGTLENTGILGLLAQTDTGEADQAPLYIAAFDNTSTPLEKKTIEVREGKGVKKEEKTIAGGQAAPLFGIDFTEDTGVYQSFTDAQKDPDNASFAPQSLIQVFDNPGPKGRAPFDILVKQLWTSGCGAGGEQVPDEGDANTAAPFCMLELTTVANTLAGISPGRVVHLLYIQNAKMLNWQNRIGDKDLAEEIAKGQTEEKDPSGPFKNFPYYNTFFKIGLDPKESNSLAQMWAWAVSDDSSALKATLKSFFESASAAG
ncbi:MAG: hypothetical protein MI802_26845 [Desulfobacterales bacterium]|nr:hypothetical protein [Desulfobacterales bacterium]